MPLDVSPSAMSSGSGTPSVVVLELAGNSGCCHFRAGLDTKTGTCQLLVIFLNLSDFQFSNVL